MNAYLITIDQEQWLAAIEGSRIFGNFDPGNYTVQLDDVADNCSVVGGATKQVTVTEGATTDAVFSVTCTALPPAAIDVTGTWIGEATEISNWSSGSVATITYVLQQTGDSVTASSMDFIGTNAGSALRSFPSVGVGRVSDTTFTLFSIVPIEGGRFQRLTRTLTVSGNQMAGGTTEQSGPYTDLSALTKQ